jgi:hypothetical protein
MIFKVDGKPYIYEGITDAEKQGIRRMSDDSVLQNRAFANMAKRKIKSPGFWR